jgi:hypothetical protein
MLENGWSYLRLQTCKRAKLYARATSVGEGVEKEKTTVNGKKSPTTPAIYRSVKKPLLQLTAWDPDSPKSGKGRVGINPYREPFKLTKSFGHHTFEGEGDAFPRKKN